MPPQDTLKVKKSKKPGGWHKVHCFLCGEWFSSVTHYGDMKKQLKKCKMCQEVPHYCYNCSDL